MAYAAFELGETIDCKPIHMAGVGVQSMRFPPIRPDRTPSPMEAFFISTAIVALAEMGDKTQLLALVLAARFRKPWPIVLGILVATLVNHGLAGAVGAWVTTFLGPQVLRWILGASFIAMAAWMLIPDKLDEGDADGKPRWGVFGTTLGMMIANAPVVWLGERITRRVPIRAVHIVSAVIFLVLGLLAIFAPTGT